MWWKITFWNVTDVYSRWWESENEWNDKSSWKCVLKAMLSNIKYTVWTVFFFPLVLVTNANLSEPRLLFCFMLSLPYTVITIVMASSTECHPDTLGSHCLLGSQNVSELQLAPHCQAIEIATKIPKWNKLWSFQNQSSAKKALYLSGRNYSVRLLLEFRQ